MTVHQSSKGKLKENFLSFFPFHFHFVWQMFPLEQPTVACQEIRGKNLRSRKEEVLIQKEGSAKTIKNLLPSFTAASA